MFQPGAALAEKIKGDDGRCRHHGDDRPFHHERQTLRRLPQTGAVVFGVKTAVTPVDALTPETRAALREALAALDPETAAYKDARPAIAALSA